MAWHLKNPRPLAGVERLFYMTESSLTSLNLEQLTNALAIVDVPSTTKVWFVRSGQGGQYWDDFRLNGYIGIDHEGVAPYPVSDANNLNLRTVQQYYREALYDILKSKENFENLSETEIANKKQSLMRKAGRRAGVLRTFRHEVSKGDMVLSPGKGTKEFILGVVTSDDQLETPEHVELDFDYDQSPYSNIRTVSWIKRVDFVDIPNEVKFIRHGNGSIFDVSEFISKLLPLFFNYYFYEGLFSARVTVGTKRPVTSDSLYLLQKVIVEIKNNPEVSITQKTKIESPGYIILTSLATDAANLLNVLNGLGVAGSIAFIVKHSDKLAGLLATIRDWGHNKNMNKLEEAATKMELLNSVNQDTLTPEQKADLNQEMLKVTQQFKLSDDPVGEDINHDEL